MIVTCPSCSASYMVPPDAIGLEGRNVKCKKCNYVWFQDSEKKVIDELISRIQENEIVVDDIGFGEGKKAAIQAKAKFSFKVILKKYTDKLPKFDYLSKSNHSLLKLCASFMVSLAFFSILCFLFVSQRDSIVKVVPQLGSFYVSTGFPMVAYANINPEEFLIIENGIVQTTDGKRVFQANLINLSSNLVRIPKLNIAYMDGKNEMILEEKRSFSFSIMPKEFSHQFHFNLPDKLSKEVKSIKFNFVD